ncbi:MAG: 2-hydroxyacid dehydrogenase [Candidatus Dormibacteraceae bacterium]
MKVLAPDSPFRAEMEPLPQGVELVSEPAPDVEVLVLGPGLTPDVAALFKQLPGLQFVQAFSAGVDRLLPLIPPGVVFCNAVGVHDAPVAEWVVAAILAMERRLPELLDAQKRGQWIREESWTRPGEDLEGKNVLVLGHGGIGRAVASRLAPFGVIVSGIARHAREGVETPEALPMRLPDADIVVNLLPSTPETKKLVNAAFLAQMKANALFLNAGRGTTVDTDALLESLQSGHIRAALDVTDPEPLPSDHPLWHAPNVLITPHIAGTVDRWEARGYRFAGEQIRRFAAVEPLVGVQRGTVD